MLLPPNTGIYDVVDRMATTGNGMPVGRHVPRAQPGSGAVTHAARWPAFRLRDRVEPRGWRGPVRPYYRRGPGCAGYWVPAVFFQLATGRGGLPDLPRYKVSDGGERLPGVT